MKRILAPLLLLALLCVCLTANAAGDTLRFDNRANTVGVGETLETILQRSGAPAEGTLTYESNNPRVATVDSEGIVTGVSKGKATITAIVKTSNKTYKAQLSVSVVRKATGIDVDKQKLSILKADDPKLAGILKEGGEDLPVLMIPVKKSVTIKASATPMDVTNRKVKITSKNENIASVRGSAVTGRSAGETVLTIASEQNPEVSVSYRVLVVQPVTRVNAEPQNPRVAVGYQLELKASVQPANATVKGITWLSSNPTVATVDKDGVVTGKSKGNVRIYATATDGSNIRANINLRVTQPAEKISLQAAQQIVAVGKTVTLKANVLPSNTDDKSVVWTSSDAKVAKVDKHGRVTGVSVGTCEITCESATTPGVTASATVTVQQPVTKIVFDEAPGVFVGETSQLTWHIEPSNASDGSLTFKSSNPKVVAVDANGILTGLRRGEATITATSTDGSKRTAKIKVKVSVHATGVHMRRRAAYINVKESATCTADLEPKEAGDTRMTWTSDDPSVATASGDRNKVKITGVSEGVTTVRGVLLDGGFETSIEVHVGNWDKSVKLTHIDVDSIRGMLNGFTVKNVSSDLTITSVTCDVFFFTYKGADIPVNTKDGSGKVSVTFKKTLYPGDSGRWKFNGKNIKDFQMPEDDVPGWIEIRVTSFQIDNDWNKGIRESRQPKFEWK